MGALEARSKGKSLGRALPVKLGFGADRGAQGEEAELANVEGRAFLEISAGARDLKGVFSPLL